MKKKLILLPFILALVYVMASSYHAGPALIGGLERTGATGTSGCGGSGCHTSGTSTTVAIELDTVTGAARTSYIAGGSYIIKVTGTNTSAAVLPKFGFQLAAVKLVGAGAPGALDGGTLATTGLPANTQNTAVSGIHVVEHSAATTPTTGVGGTGTTYVRLIIWTPPAAGTGSVKLYATINAVNGTGGTDGDLYNSNSVIITESIAPVAAITGTLSVCVGANTTLADATAGGTWSSGTPGVATVIGGVVHGVTPGTTVISYNAGTAGTATATVTVTGPASAGTIVGAAAICAGATLSLTNPTATGTGVWSTTTTTIATVNSASGVVTGVAAGSAVITYTATNLCGSSTTTVTVPVNALPNAGAITGADSVCIGSVVTLSSSGTAGGAWVSSATGFATVTSAGVVSGVATGLTIISYTATTSSCGSATATRPITVKALPVAGTLSGSNAVCAGAQVTLSSTVAGGTWSTGAGGPATVTGAGVVTGLTAGLATLTYTVTGFCGSATATYSDTVKALPVAGFITGAATLCLGSNLTLTDVAGATGGTWSTTTPLIATVNGSGMVSSLTAGTAQITYSVANSCGTDFTTHSVVIDPVLSAGAISGITTECVGISATLASSGSAGGTWTTTTGTVATVGASSGIVTGVAAGTSIISYVVRNTCNADSVGYTITINPAPNAGTISGAGTVCTGATTSLTSSGTAGGTWTSSFIPFATITSGGVVTGVAVGTTVISYSVTNSCGTASAGHIVTVNTIPSAGTITGAGTVCAGSSISLTDGTTGGTWTSGTTAFATVTTGGTVGGVAAGTSVISYTVTNLCGTASATHSVTVNPLAVAGTITGAGTLCVGATTSLADGTTGGTWTSANPAFATVTSGGVVTGVAAGTAVISYSVTNGCGTVAAVHTVVVNGPPSAGTISGTAFVCVGISASLADGVGGGTWTTDAPAFVTVSGSGVITGTGVGSAVISYSVVGTCGTGVATYPVSSGLSASAGTITGPTAVCAASGITLSDLTTGGSWTSGAATIATVNGSGVVTGVNAGSATITYTVISSCGTAATSYTITVNPLPVPGVISGTSNVCVGSSVSLTETISGGTWSSSAPAIATIDASGNVTGLAPGTFIAVYTVTNGCGSVTALHTMLSTAVPVSATISGPANLCQGSTAVLSASAAGGVWSAANASASVNAGGVVTGLTYGIDTISYTISNICGAAVATYTDTIYPTTVAGGIVGASTVCIGDTVQYAVLVPGGTFTLSNGNAIVDTLTGSLIPVSAGADTISYTLTNVCGTSSASMVLHVLSAAACAAGVNSTANTIQGIRIFPNPTDGVFTIEVPRLGNDAVVTITNIFGKTIETRVIDKSASATTFDLSSLAAGSYLIKVTSGESTFRDKIVIW